MCTFNFNNISNWVFKAFTNLPLIQWCFAKVAKKWHKASILWKLIIISLMAYEFSLKQHKWIVNNFVNNVWCDDDDVMWYENGSIPQRRHHGKDAFFELENSVGAIVNCLRWSLVQLKRKPKYWREVFFIHHTPFIHGNQQQSTAPTKQKYFYIKV